MSRAAVDSRSGQCATAAADTLEAAVILAALSAGSATVEVVDQVDSTNRVLLERAPVARPRVLIARRQTAGRGRAGRPWLADAEGSLCLSLAWSSRRTPRELAPAGIVAGVAAATALHALGAHAVGLKWPNDLLANDAKLGGILVEARATAKGSLLVIGVGLNVRLPALLAADVDAIAAANAGMPCTDLHSQLGAATPSRNRLAACLIEALLAQLGTFERDGPAAALAAWPRFDLLAGRSVRVFGTAGERHGIARGLAADGALRVDFPEGEACVYSGEVSVRT